MKPIKLKKTDKSSDGSQTPVIPTTVRKGQTLFCMGYRCVVSGFMAPCFVLLRGEWGMGKGHERENAVPASAADFASYGVRLPFPGEVDDQ